MSNHTDTSELTPPTKEQLMESLVKAGCEITRLLAKLEEANSRLKINEAGLLDEMREHEYTKGELEEAKKNTKNAEMRAGIWMRLYSMGRLPAEVNYAFEKELAAIAQKEGK
jgi:ribosomal protein S21